MNSSPKHFFLYQFPALAWAAIIFIASSSPGPQMPQLAHLVNDKIIHASIYFVFGLLIYRAFATRENPDEFVWRRVIFSVVLVILYGVSDEFHQGFVPGRTKDILDASADAFGGLVSAVVVYLLSRRKAGKVAGSM